MNNNSRRNPLKRLLTPLLAYWGTILVAELLVSLVLILLNAEELGEITGSADMADDAAFNSAIQQALILFTKVTLKYQTQINGIVMLCTIPVSYLFFFRKDRMWEKEQSLPAPEQAPAKDYIWLVVFSIAFNLGMSCLMTLTNLATSDQGYLDTSAAFYYAPVPVQVLCLGIIVPLAEELMFRGILFKRCRENSSFWGAAFLSAILFVLVHSNSVQMIYTMVLGLFLAYVYEKYASFKAPVLVHMAANLTAVLGQASGVYEWIGSSTIRMGAAVVVCTFVSVTVVVLIRGMGKSEEKDQKE